MRHRVRGRLGGTGDRDRLVRVAARQLADVDGRWHPDGFRRAARPGRRAVRKSHARRWNGELGAAAAPATGTRGCRLVGLMRSGRRTRSPMRGRSLPVRVAVWRPRAGHPTSMPDGAGFQYADTGSFRGGSGRARANRLAPRCAGQRGRYGDASALAAPIRPSTPVARKRYQPSCALWNSPLMPTPTASRGPDHHPQRGEQAEHAENQRGTAERPMGDGQRAPRAEEKQAESRRPPRRGSVRRPASSQGRVGHRAGEPVELPAG